MIKFEHTITPSPEEMKFVIEGMRNPMESWDQSDSGWNYILKPTWMLGFNDRDLMKRLCKAGSDERKFMRQMPVMVRITAPLYWWKEFDTYKVGTTSNSCSTMHKIHAHPFSLKDFSCEHLFDSFSSKEEKAVINFYDSLEIYESDPGEDESDMLISLTPISVLNATIHALNKSREAYLKTNDKDYWWQMIQLLPSSYNQTRNITLNYEVLHNMYHARKHHKLDEWRIGFCDWCKTLPYSELITEEWEESSEETSTEGGYKLV